MIHIQPTKADRAAAALLLPLAAAAIAAACWTHYAAEARADAIGRLRPCVEESAAREAGLAAGTWRADDEQALWARCSHE